MLARKIVSILAIGFGFLTSPLHAQIVDTVCAGARGEVYQVIQKSGSTYQWNVSGGNIIEGQTTSAVKVNWGADTGLYEITVKETNSIGCPGDLVRAFVWVRGGIKVNILGPSTICKGDDVILLATGANKYRWNTGSQGSSTLLTPSTDTTIRVIGESATCGLDTAFINIKVHKKPEATVILNPPLPDLNQTVEMFVEGDVEASDVLWTIPEESLVTQAPEIYHTFTRTGNYTIQALVVDTNGCKDTVQTDIELKVAVYVFTPNAFTPNADELNNVFTPVTSNVKRVSLQVFSRWGEKIYDATALDGSQMGWDGTFKGDLSPSGVYVYKIQAIGLDDKIYTYEGTVQLIR